MMHRALLSLCTIVVLISFAHAQSSREKRENQDRRLNPQAPLQAELLAPVDANKLSLGAAVFAKARVDWNDPSCHLRTGSVVTGHIVAIEKRTKQSKGSSLTIAFDHADCDGRIAPIQFTLFAIIAAPEVDEGVPLRDSSTNFGTSSTQPHMSLAGGGGGSSAHAPTPIASKDDMSLNGKTTDDNTPKVIQAGQVIGLKKVTLSVGTGPHRPHTEINTRSKLHAPQPHRSSHAAAPTRTQTRSSPAAAPTRDRRDQHLHRPLLPRPRRHRSRGSPRLSYHLHRRLWFRAPRHTRVLRIRLRIHPHLPRRPEPSLHV
jgi:hypothetical protein